MATETGSPDSTTIIMTSDETETATASSGSRSSHLRQAVSTALSTTMGRISTAMETLWNPPWNTIRDMMMDPRRGSLVRGTGTRPSSCQRRSESRRRRSSRHDVRSRGWTGAFSVPTFLPPPHSYVIRPDQDSQDSTMSSPDDPPGESSQHPSQSSAPLLPSSSTHCPSLPSCLRGSTSLSNDHRSLGYSILDPGSQTSLPSGDVSSYHPGSCHASSSLPSYPQNHVRRQRSSRSRASRRSRFPDYGLYDDDGRDKNFLSALLSILVIATLATALTQPKWFSIRGGVCGRKFIGLQLFIELNSHSSFSSLSGGRSSAQTANNNQFVNSNLNTEDVNDINHRSRNGGSFKVGSINNNEGNGELLPKPQSSIFSPFDPASVAVFPDSFDKVFNQTLLSTPHLVVNDTENAFMTEVFEKKKEAQHKKHDRSSVMGSTAHEKWSTLSHERKPKSCSYLDILPLQRMIILLCLLAIMLNLSQFFLDTLGTQKKLLNLLRLHGVGSILGVILTIVIIGLSYMITAMVELDERTALTQIYSSQVTLDSLSSGHSMPPLALPVASLSTPSPAASTKERPLYTNGQHLEIRFELSYYLVTLSGLIGLMAAACNLLRKPTVPFLYPSHSLLLDPLLFPDGDDSRSPIWTGSLAPGSSSMRLPRLLTGLPPPPPPYSP